MSEEKEDISIDARLEALEQYPQWTRKAQKVIHISVIPSEKCVDQKLYNVTNGSDGDIVTLRDKNESLTTFPAWQPQFVHQAFPSEVVWGYDNPKVWVVYSDPELSISASVFAREKLSEKGLTIHDIGDEGLSHRLVPDELSACLGKILPDLPEEALSLPLHSFQTNPLHFYPALAESFVFDKFEICATYTVQDKEYTICRWQPAASERNRAYFRRMQTLAFWSIETASMCDETDPSWWVYSIGIHVNGVLQRFVGYATVYLTMNPFRRQTPYNLQLGQMLVLPAYQRSGHGKRLLYCIFDDMELHNQHQGTNEGSKDGDDAFFGASTPNSEPEGASQALSPYKTSLPGSIRSISIVSPCEEMSLLRLRVDLERALSRDTLSFLPGWETFSLRDYFVSSPSSTEAALVSANGDETSAPRWRCKFTPGSGPQDPLSYPVLPLRHIRSLTTDEERRISHELLITRQQANHVYLTLLLFRSNPYTILENPPTANQENRISGRKEEESNLHAGLKRQLPGDEEEAAEKRTFRLCVKRFYATHDEEIQALLCPQAKKDALQLSYQEFVALAALSLSSIDVSTYLLTNEDKQSKDGLSTITPRFFSPNASSSCRLLSKNWAEYAKILWHQARDEYEAANES